MPLLCDALRHPPGAPRQDLHECQKGDLGADLTFPSCLVSYFSISPQYEAKSWPPSQTLAGDRHGAGPSRSRNLQTSSLEPWIIGRTWWPLGRWGEVCWHSLCMNEGIWGQQILNFREKYFILLLPKEICWGPWHLRANHSSWRCEGEKHGMFSRQVLSDCWSSTGGCVWLEGHLGFLSKS